MNPLTQKLKFRPFAETDSLEELTLLINKAYQPLADSGFRYLGSYQDVKKTAERVNQGECWIALNSKAIVGTIRYRPPGPSKNEWYNQAGVASFGQFAVALKFQKLGIGNKLLQIAESLALRDGAREIALDTAENVTNLVNYYIKKGYRPVGYEHWDITNYRSVILSKSLAPFQTPG